MKNSFLQNVNSLLAVILAAEKKEQEKYYIAVNSNASDSTRIMAKANARIKKLRDVINRLKDFHFEVMEILEGEDEDNEVIPETYSDEDLITKVCEALIVAKPFKFLSLESSFVAIDPSGLDEPFVKLSNSMYVSTAAPADVICKDVLAKCGVEEHEYKLYYEGVQA